MNALSRMRVIALLLFCLANSNDLYAQKRNAFSIEGGVPFGWKNSESTIDEDSQTKEYKNFTLSLLYSRVIKKQFGMEAGMSFTSKGNSSCSEHYTGNAAWLSLLIGANYNWPIFKNFYLVPFIDVGAAMVEYGSQTIPGYIYSHVGGDEFQIAPIFKGGLRFAYELSRFRFSFSMDYEHLFIRDKDLKYYSQTFYDFKVPGLQYSFNSFNAKLGVGLVF